MKMKISDMKDNIPYMVVRPVRDLLSIDDCIKRNGLHLRRLGPYPIDLNIKMNRVIDVEIDTYSINRELEYCRSLIRESRKKVEQLKEALK